MGISNFQQSLIGVIIINIKQTNLFKIGELCHTNKQIITCFVSTEDAPERIVHGLTEHMITVKLSGGMINIGGLDDDNDILTAIANGLPTI